MTNFSQLPATVAHCRVEKGSNLLKSVVLIAFFQQAAASGNKRWSTDEMCVRCEQGPTFVAF